MSGAGAREVVVDGVRLPAFAPSFFVAGAQKAGTTTLHAWLAALPGVALPRDKETHYFTHPERAALGPEWYQAQFVEGERRVGTPPLRGEVDPELLHHPRAAARLARLATPPRAVVVLRDPLERARSHHAMSVARGLERLPFAEAVTLEAERCAIGGPDGFAARHHAYLGRSCYRDALARLRHELGSERVLLVRFEDLFAGDGEGGPARRAAALGRILCFVGYEGEQPSSTPAVAHNGRWSPRSRALARVLHGEGRLRRVLGKACPSRELRRRIGRVLDRANRGDAASAPSTPEPPLPTTLRDAFVRAVDEAEAATGWDLAAWRRNAEAA